MRFLCLPKTVRISDVRLNIVYMILMFCTWLVILLKFVLQKEFVRQSTAFLTATVWPHGSSDPDVYMRHWETSLNQSYCTSRYTYNYNAGYNYNVTGCADPSWAPGFHQESDQSLVFPTHVREQKLDTLKEQWTTSIDIVGVGWEYSFEEVGTPGQKDLVYDTKSEITTILMNNAGKEMKRIEPGRPLELTMASMFEMAGFSNLDSVNQKGAPIGKDSTHTGPIYRLSGLQLDFVADCEPQFNLRRLIRKVKTNMTCKIHVKQSKRNWIYVSTQRYRDENGDAVTMSYHGVRVTFSHLQVEEISVSRIIESLADAFVLASIPVLFMEFVVVHFLGALSPIYRRATSEAFSIQKEVGSMVVRLIAMSAIFVDLQDGSGCISRSRCEERLTVLFNHVQDLSPHEVESIAEYCYTSVALNTIHENRGYFHAINKVLQGLNRASNTTRVSESNGIDSATFSAACSSMENIGFHEVLHLFDLRRTGGCLERFFMPTDLHVALTSHRKYVEQKRGKGESSASLDDLPRSVTAEESLTNCSTLERRKEVMLKKVFTADEKIVNLEKILAEMQEKYEVHRKDLHNLLHNFQQEVTERMKHVEGKLDTDPQKGKDRTSKEGATAAKDTAGQHRSTSQDVMAMCRVVEACNSECSILNKSVGSIANNLVRGDVRL